VRYWKLQLSSRLSSPFFFDNGNGGLVVRHVDCVAHGGVLEPGHRLMEVGRLFHGDVLTRVIPRHFPLSVMFGIVRNMHACSAGKAVNNTGVA